MLRALLLILALLWAPLAEASTSLTVSDPAVTSFASGWVFQRISDTNLTYNMAVAGTWTGGSQPTAVDCKVNIVAGGTAQAFTALTSFASTVGGAYSGTLNVPEGAFYTLTCQDHNNTSANGSQTNNWGVGVRAWHSGASNSYLMWQQGVGTPNGYTAGYFPNTGTVGFGAITGEAENIFANTFQVGLGTAPVSGTPIPVGWIMGGVPAASISQWIVGGGAWTFYDPFFPDSGDFEFFILNCGDADSLSTNNPQTFWPTDVASALAQFHTFTGRTTTTGHMIMGVSGPGFGGSPGDDLGKSQVRWAQQAFALGTAGVSLGSANLDVVTVDGEHYAQSWFDRQALRYTQSMLSVLGLSAQNSVSPQFTTCTGVSTTISCNVQQGTGTGLALENTGSTGTPYPFCINSANAPQKVGSCAIAVTNLTVVDATHVTLTAASAPTYPAYLSVEYGDIYGVANGAPQNFLASTPAVAGDTLGLALLITNPAAPIQINAPAAGAPGSGRFRLP